MLDIQNCPVMSGAYFVVGIDTDIGKSVATGVLAKKLLDAGCRTITQKMVQTGCSDMADDILTHRKIMGMPLQSVDEARLTMPKIYKYPASPHLASQLEGAEIDGQVMADIYHATNQLLGQYDVVLIEGAGGLMVPLNNEMLIIDYIKQYHYPVILVCSGRLGSINHTLLSLLAIKNYDLNLFAVIYNRVHDSQDAVIAKDTAKFLENYIKKHFPASDFWHLKEVKGL